MKQFKYYLMAALLLPQLAGFSSCSDNDDEESTVNPAVDVVTKPNNTTQPFYSVLLRYL